MFKVQLNTIKDVCDFNACVMSFKFGVDLVSGRYTVDAKSLMGIYSLDLSKAITVEVSEAISDADKNALKTALKPFIVEA